MTAQSTAATAATRASEPRLRLSADLATPAPVADDEERQLLRVEWKVAQSRDGETDALERVRKLEAAAAQVRSALERAQGPADATLPVGPPPPAVARAPQTQAAPVPAGNRAATDAAPVAADPAVAVEAWLAAAGVALMLAAAGAVLWVRRRRPAPPPQALDTALTVLADPPPAALRRRRRRPT